MEFYFVTSGWVPSGYNSISLPTSWLTKTDAAKQLYILMKHLHEENFGQRCGFFTFADSDSYISIQNHLQSLSKRDPNEHFYGGKKFSVKYDNSLPFVNIISGLAITLSKKTMESLDINELQKCSNELIVGYYDVDLFLCLQRLQINPTNRFNAGDHYIFDNIMQTFNKKKEADKKCLVAAHKVLPVVMFELHKALISQDHHIMCEYD